MNCQDRVFPSWNRRGGCASKKKMRSLRSGADGVVIMVNVDVLKLSGTDHPVCAFIRRLRSIFLMAQPPLLSEEGNTPSCNSFTPFMSAGFSWNQRNAGGHRPPLQLRAKRFTRVFFRLLLYGSKTPLGRVTDSWGQQGNQSFWCSTWRLRGRENELSHSPKRLYSVSL